MSIITLPQFVCGVIPDHMMTRVAAYGGGETSDNARATLEHMRELAAGGVQTLIESFPETTSQEPSDDRQRVHDAGSLYELPGRQVLPGEYADNAGDAGQGGDVQVTEAWDHNGVTLDFLERVFERRSIDGLGLRIDSTVHYGTGFGNAMWTGRQMVYGDGDGLVFTSFTRGVDVTAHELAHGLLQHTAALGYSGETGALNEHIADAIASMVKQSMLGQTAFEADWLIGDSVFGPLVHADGVRCLALPGSAYDDPILGLDPQPSHMRDYVETAADNGGVHINSGILNHAFYLFSMEIGGYTWEVQAPLYYSVVTEQLTADAGFDDFARAMVEIAGELYGFDSEIQQAIGRAFADVGLLEAGYSCPSFRARAAAHRARYAASAAAKRRTRWHRDYAGRALINNNNTNKERNLK
jgi:Zn-dependent metalloprotease